MASFIVGYDFDGATGLKLGSDLNALVALAKFAPASTALDNTTIEADSGGRARVKDGGITGPKVDDAALGDGLTKAPTGELQIDADGTTLQFTDGKLELRDASGFVAIDEITIVESSGSAGEPPIGQLYVGNLGVGTEQLAAEGVTHEKIAPDAVDFSQWDVETLTTDETPPLTLAEGKLHIVYEEA